MFISDASTISQVAPAWLKNLRFINNSSIRFPPVSLGSADFNPQSRQFSVYHLLINSNKQPLALIANIHLMGYN
jgi:hypothetical protein